MTHADMKSFCALPDSHSRSTDAGFATDAFRVGSQAAARDVVTRIPAAPAYSDGSVTSDSAWRSVARGSLRWRPTWTIFAK